jgi:hypothetical protein
MRKPRTTKWTVKFYASTGLFYVFANGETMGSFVTPKEVNDFLSVYRSTYPNDKFPTELPT